MAMVGHGVAQSVPKMLRLELAKGGAYVLDGKPVERAALTEVFLRHKREDGSLMVALVPSLDGKSEDVNFAMEAVRKAGGRVALVGGEAFYPSGKVSGAQR